MDSNQLVLPVEVWQKIFELATQYEAASDPESKKFKQSTYSPFSHYRVKPCQTLVESKKCFRAKLGLLHVCRSWHSMAQRCAYEVIYVGNHAASLVVALKRSAKMNDGQGYGQFVRRIVLVSGSRRAANKNAFLKVIEACPNATMLVKYDQDHTVIPASLPPLPALVRYDWSFENEISSDYPPHPSDIYALRDIIRKTPNLEYLSICLCRVYRFSQKIMLEREPISTNITTLRVCHQYACPSILDELSRWSFPNIKHLIADPDLLTNTVPPYFNSQIEVIEFTELPERALFVHNFGAPRLKTSCLFDACPNLREMYFYLSSYILTHPAPRSTKIERMGIHRGKWEHRHYSPWGDDYGSHVHLARRFEKITKVSFPRLQAIILYGDWVPVLTAHFWPPIEEGLNQRGFLLEYPDGRPVEDTNTFKLLSGLSQSTP